jgi:hypothetical protein
MIRYIAWPERRNEIIENFTRELLATDPKKPWEITLKPYKKSRSDEQNAALWGVAYPPLVAHTGFTAEEIHEAMCIGFFGKLPKYVLGEYLLYPRRTTTTNYEGERDLLSASVFADFYAYVQRRGAEAGVDIPDPEPKGMR